MSPLGGTRRQEQLTESTAKHGRDMSGYVGMTGYTGWNRSLVSDFGKEFKWEYDNYTFGNWVNVSANETQT